MNYVFYVASARHTVIIFLPLRSSAIKTISISVLLSSTGFVIVAWPPGAEIDERRPGTELLPPFIGVPLQIRRTCCWPTKRQRTDAHGTLGPWGSIAYGMAFRFNPDMRISISRFHFSVAASACAQAATPKMKPATSATPIETSAAGVRKEILHVSRSTQRTARANAGG